MFSRFQRQRQIYLRIAAWNWLSACIALLSMFWLLEVASFALNDFNSLMCVTATDSTQRDKFDKNVAEMKHLQ